MNSIMLFYLVDVMCEPWLCLQATFLCPFWACFHWLIHCFGRLQVVMVDPFEYVARNATGKGSACCPTGNGQKSKCCPEETAQSKKCCPEETAQSKKCCPTDKGQGNKCCPGDKAQSKKCCPTEKVKSKCCGGKWTTNWNVVYTMLTCRR